MTTELIIIMLVLLGAMASTVPVFMSLFFTSLVGFAFFADLPLLMMAQTMFRSMDKFALVVVLFFVLCGNIMTAGSIVDKLIRVANAVVGWLPGGLGMAGVLACGLFGAISGSTVATVVAIGGFMIPALLEQKYEERYAIGVMTTSPVLGVIIPPSISMILYSMVTSCSLEKLFMTGFVPGVFIMAAVCVYTYVVCRRGDQVPTPVPTFREVLTAFRVGFWSLMLPVIIFGGIFSGVFTANEAAVVACVYAFIVEIFIHKDMKWNQVFKVTVNSAITSATLLIIVAGATCFGRYLSLRGIPTMITDAVVGQIQSPLVFLMAMNIILLVVGMFMDIISATLILTPIFLPMLGSFDINILHFGLLMTVNLGIGYCTPPLGVSLYITGALVNRDLIYVTRSVIPFLIIQIIILLILTYWPEAVLYPAETVLRQPGLNAFSDGPEQRRQISPPLWRAYSLRRGGRLTRWFDQKHRGFAAVQHVVGDPAHIPVLKLGAAVVGQQDDVDVFIVRGITNEAGGVSGSDGPFILDARLFEDLGRISHGLFGKHPFFFHNRFF